MNRIKIDIHNSVRKLQYGKEQLMHDSSLSERNRKFILNFLSDAKLGKTILKKQKKKINERTCLKYLTALKIVGRNLNKDFDKVTIEDMQTFIEELENDAITKKNGMPYSPQTKKDIKITIKKFYKWLLGNNETYPPLVSSIDTSLSPEYYTAISEKEVEKLVETAETVQEKAFVSLLFDLGARIEEFLNIQFEDITKTKEGYKVHIRFSKTFSRTLPLDKSILHLEKWLLLHQKKEHRLFPFSYYQSRDKLLRLGEQALGMRLTHQIIRHSKATQLAQAGVGRYQMCEWMGWSMSSKMPDRYIRREGIDNEKTLEFIKQRQAKIEG